MSRFYKIQNRTNQSKRVLIDKKYDGTINFETDPPLSYNENSRRAGWCLSPLNVIPERTPAYSRVELTSHPMGVDGRVSILINGTLTISERYSNLATIRLRQNWFNTVFGEYVEYTGKYTARFISAETESLITLVFEDDDIDYRFNDFSAINASDNQSLFVEPYRLAFDLNKTTNRVLRVTQSTIERFDPTYWRVDGPNTASFSVVSIPNGFEVNFDCRIKSDLVGVSWDSEDFKDHEYLSYATNYDYRGLKWTFDIELSDTMPTFDTIEASPAITVNYRDSQGRPGVAYIALKNYIDNPTGRSGHVIIDWDTVKGGFGNTSDFNKANITKIFFSGYVSAYEKVYEPLPQTTSGYIRVTNSKVTGSNTRLTLQQVIVHKHDMGMCTSYDDHYDLNPARIVKNLKVLGYTGFINHYCGMSHYPVIHWDHTDNRFKIPDTFVTGEDVVNHPTRRWHEEYAKALQENGFEPVFSVSFEMYSQGANEFWAQREWNDTIGRTGYEPPSYFFSLCHENGLAYLDKAFDEMAQTMVYGGCRVNMQIGEPWWWYNVASTNPCVYDLKTREAFHADTGLHAPDFGTIFEAVTKTGTPYDEFREWLRNKLGMTCRNIRTKLKQKYPDALVCPLIFFPSIQTHQDSLVRYINYPREHYSYPNFDYIMTEAYDWILEARLDLTKDAVSRIPLQEMNYPPEKVCYLVGFVPDSAIAYIYGFDYEKAYRAPLWQRIYGDFLNNANVGIFKQLVWAYPQVMFDSLTLDGSLDLIDGFFMKDDFVKAIRDNTPYPEDIKGDDLNPWEPPPTILPIGIKALKSTWGDYRITFDVENDKPGLSFNVQLLNSTGLHPLWNGITTTHYFDISSVQANEVGLTEPLKVIVIPSEGSPSEIIDIDPIHDDSWVTTPPVSNIEAVKVGEDILVSWGAEGYEQFIVRQYNVADGSLIYKRTITEPSDTFTAAEQTDEYGFTASTIRVLISGFDPADGTESLSITFTHTF